MKTTTLFTHFTVIWLISLGMYALPVYARVCDSSLKPEKNSTIAYMQRGSQQSKRCEGFYRRPIAVKELVVVNVVKGHFQYKLNRKEKIEVSAPLLRQTINVRAVGTKARTYYRMDARVASRQKLIWPVKDVLYKKQGLYKNIGVFGWITTKTGKTYVPVMARGQMHSGNQDNSIRLGFIANTNKDVSEVRWRYDKKSCAFKNSAWQKSKRRYRAGNPINIKLPSSSSGKLCVEVKAKTASKWLSEIIKITEK